MTTTATTPVRSGEDLDTRMRHIRDLFVSEAMRVRSEFDRGDKHLASLADIVLKEATKADPHGNEYVGAYLQAMEAINLLALFDETILPEEEQRKFKRALFPATERLLWAAIVNGWALAVGIEDEQKFGDLILGRDTDRSDEVWGAMLREGMKNTDELPKFYRLLARANGKSNEETVATAFRSIARCRGGHEATRLAAKFLNALHNDGNVTSDVAQMCLDYTTALATTGRAARTISLLFPYLPGLAYSGPSLKVHTHSFVEFVWRVAYNQSLHDLDEPYLEQWLETAGKSVEKWWNEHEDVPKFCVTLTCQLLESQWQLHDLDAPVEKTIQRSV